MFNDLTKMMGMMKNIDTSKLQWYYKLIGELRKKQLEKNVKKLNDNAQELYEDPIINSLMPVIEMTTNDLKLDKNKSLNIIADAYIHGKTTEEVVEELLENAKKK